MSGVLVSAVGTLLVLFLVYAFQGILSFIPYLFGWLFNVLFYPVELISQVIYPVSPFVYFIYIGLLFGLVFKFILSIFHKN